MSFSRSRPLGGLFFVLLFLLGGGSLAAAQQVATTTSSVAAVQTHVITVGKGDHRMIPDVTQADVGDIIEFQFFPVNHSIVRAEYMSPCIPYELTGKNKKGFFSGFYPVDAILDNPPKWRIVLNDSLPIFFYCSAPGSCINYQMVGVINPNASVSLVSHKQAAKDSKFMLQPGESFPSEGGPSTTTTSATATSTSTAKSTSAAATITAAAAPSHPGLSGGAIAGIAIGSSAVVLMAAALFFLLGRQKTLTDVIRRESFVAAGKDPRGPSRTSMSAHFGYAGSPGSISGSNSDATRKHHQYGDYHDGNGYEPRYSNQGEYLAPVPIVPRNHSPSVLESAEDSPAPMSPQGSVAGGRTSRQSYTSYTPGDDRSQMGRNMTSASRRGPHELFTPLDEDVVQYQDDTPSPAPPPPTRQLPQHGAGGYEKEYQR